MSEWDVSEFKLRLVATANAKMHKSLMRYAGLPPSQGVHLNSAFVTP